MIVTACTIDRQPQENLADGGDDIIKFVGAGQSAIRRCIIERSQVDKSPSPSSSPVVTSSNSSPAICSRTKPTRTAWSSLSDLMT